MKVVAEGIESQQLLEAARSLHCDFVQGFYLGAPMFFEDSFEVFCQRSLNEGLRLVA